MAAAAFFDLDRTLVKTATWPVLAAALADAELLPLQHFPGQSVMFDLYDAFGETLVGLAGTRALAGRFKGVSEADARTAADVAADGLVSKVAPFVPPIMEHHRRAGRKVVLATTTPEFLVQPLADRLAVDAVIATRYQVGADGRFTGRLDGRFVWNMGKLGSVQEWARLNHIDLPESYAYTDSVYDLPLLRAVGHPVAVQPDLRLRAVATAAGWEQRWFDAPPGVPRFAGVEPYIPIISLFHPDLMRFARFVFEGAAHIPASGGVLVAANHRSYFDPVVLAMMGHAAGRQLRFMAKKEITDAPLLGPVVRALGTIRVDRGGETTVAVSEATDALAAGEAIAILPQGTIPRGRDFFEPTLAGRPGVVRLAWASGAPIVPVGVWGTEHVWPRSRKIPNVTNLADPPTVSATAGPPIDLKRRSEQADLRRVMDGIRALLPAEARRRRVPTDDEIRLATPGR